MVSATRPLVVIATGTASLLMSAPALAKQPSGIVSVRHCPTGAERSTPVIGTNPAEAPRVTGAVGGVTGFTGVVGGLGEVGGCAGGVVGPGTLGGLTGG